MMNKILNQRTDLWNKVFLFLITTLSVFVILIPRTFFGFDLTDTFFALELQVLLERDGPVYWNYIFLTNYIGLLWIKLCPIDNLFWWCHLGGVLTISLTSGLSFLIADKLLDVSRKIICAAVIVATVMVSWANCSLLVNYYTVPTLIFTLLLYLVLFIRPDRWSLFFVIGLLSAAEIGSRWPTAVLFIIPFVYIVFRKLTDSDFSLTRLKEYFPAVLIYLAGLVIGILTVYGLMCHYNVFERNSSGVHRGFEYVFYYLRIYLMNFPLIYACLFLWLETAIKRFWIEKKRGTLLDIVIVLIALPTFVNLFYFQINYIINGVYWDNAYTSQHFLYAMIGYYILLRFFLACGFIKQLMQQLSNCMPCSIPLLEKKDCFGDGMDIIFKFTSCPGPNFLAYIFTYIIAGIIFPFGSDGIYYYNYCMLPLVWAIVLIGVYYSRHIMKKLFYFRAFMILLLLCSGLGLTFFASYRDGVLHKLTANFKTPQLDLLYSTPQRVESIDHVLAYLKGKVSNTDDLLVIGQESFFYFYLPCKPWEQWIDYTTLRKRLLRAREAGQEKLPHYILISLSSKYPDTEKMTEFVKKHIAQAGVYQQVYCDKGYLVYKRLK